MKIASIIHIIVALSISFASADDKQEPKAEGLEPLFPKQLYGELQKSSKAPEGMITVIREKGSWKFKILSSETGWNTGSGIDQMILRGGGYEVPVALSKFTTLPDSKRSYTYIVLSDEMVKSASLELHWSSLGRGGNRAILYTLKLSELVK